MHEELFGRPALLRIAEKATGEEFLRQTGRRRRKLVDGRMVGGDLENGGHALEFMPRRIAGQHLNYGAAKAPGKTRNSAFQFVCGI